MKLLIITQKIDEKDPTLGFFCSWVKAFSSRSETVSVICLEKGEYHLPKNVSVFSLGKEEGLSKFAYIKNFYNYISNLRESYDTVFVHMNQEYILLGGLYWKFKNIPVYFWRNHGKGSFLTRIAVLFSKKVFYTSGSSFTAKFKNSVQMPAGVDVSVFKNISSVSRKSHSICMVGRLSPVKHVDVCLEAVKILLDSGVQVSLSIVGPVSLKDTEYTDSLKNFVKENHMELYINFIEALPQEKLPEIYASHEICVNLTSSGSFDKTIVEAASCGAVPLTSNESLWPFLPEISRTSNDPKKLSEDIIKAMVPESRLRAREEFQKFVSENSLSNLFQKIFKEIQ